MTLDVTNNGNLTNLVCRDNNLLSLNLANGNNTAIVVFNALLNPNLTCIQVDDSVWSANNWNNIDPTASFSENCGNSICVNTFSNITVDTSCGSYVAPDGSILANSGQYQIIIPNSAGCDSIITIDLNLVILIDPNIQYTTDGTGLSYSSGGSFQWLDCDAGFLPIPGETSNVFYPTKTGNYALEITEFGCTVISPCESVVLSSLDFEDPINFNIYPNPSTYTITVTFYKPEPIKVFNTFGQIVFHNEDSEQYIIDISNLTKGIYFVRSGNAIKKFIKK